MKNWRLEEWALPYSEYRLVGQEYPTSKVTNNKVRFAVGFVVLARKPFLHELLVGIRWEHDRREQIWLTMGCKHREGERVWPDVASRSKSSYEFRVTVLEKARSEERGELLASPNEREVRWYECEQRNMVTYCPCPLSSFTLYLYTSSNRER